MGVLICCTFERNVDVGVLSNTLYCHRFIFGCDGEPKRHLFQTKWSHKQLDFFDVDESHVVYSMKSSPSFVVHCFKTGAKLWELVPTVTSFLELRDLSHGLLLTNNLNGLIRLVRKFKNSFYHSGSNIKYFGLLRIWRLQKQETALVGSISQTTQILCVRYFTTLLLFLSYIRSSLKFIF